jgi:tryptophan-rich sensory protein
MQNQLLPLAEQPLTPARSSANYKWWQAALVGIAANAVSALPAGYNGNEAFYNNLQQPSIAPPDWAFAPVWLFNNVTSLYAGLRVANLPEGTKGKKIFLVLEGTNWVLFAAFSSLYFGLKSPVLGAIDTTASLAITTVNLKIASRMDKKVALGILPRFAWLALATFVSVYIAVKNPDPLFNLSSRG